jgi:hypothetical protein
MIMSEKYGVLVLKYEFLLSVILFTGGGLLIWQDKSLITPIFTIFGVLITFWFNRRSSETTASNLMTAMQTQPPPQIPQIPQIPQEPQTQKGANE